MIIELPVLFDSRMNGKLFDSVIYRACCVCLWAILSFCKMSDMNVKIILEKAPLWRIIFI